MTPPASLLKENDVQSEYLFSISSHVIRPPIVLIINFNGGSRQIRCPGWEDNIVMAYATYGALSTIPTLWIYGQNDTYWSSDLVKRILDSYRKNGGKAELVDVGVFKEDAHQVPGDPDGTHLWWPATEKFLANLGLPTAIQFRPPEDVMPPTHFAEINQISAVPRLDEVGRKGYRDFLAHGNPRVFVLSDEGKWSFSAGGIDSIEMALIGCQKKSQTLCRPYAIDD